MKIPCRVDLSECPACTPYRHYRFRSPTIARRSFAVPPPLGAQGYGRGRFFFRIFHAPGCELPCMCVSPELFFPFSRYSGIRIMLSLQCSTSPASLTASRYSFSLTGVRIWGYRVATANRVSLADSLIRSGTEISFFIRIVMSAARSWIRGNEIRW